MYRNQKKNNNIGTWDEPIINDTSTTQGSWGEQVEGVVLYENVLGKPKVVADGRQVTKIEYTDLSEENLLETQNNYIDTTYIPFKNDEDFEIETTFLCRPSDSTFSSTFVSLLSCITWDTSSGSTKFANGFELRITKSGSSYILGFAYTTNNSTSNLKSIGTVTSSTSRKIYVKITKTGSTVGYIIQDKTNNSFNVNTSYNISNSNSGSYPLTIGARLGSNGEYSYNSNIKIESFRFEMVS